MAAAEVPGPGTGVPAPDAVGFLSFAETALDKTVERLPGTDRSAMAMVLFLHRVVNSLVYDLESTVHRPAGWSWSAFRLLFTLWVSGPQESSGAAELAGMSRAAVSALAKTLEAAGLLERTPDERDRRGVVLSLTPTGLHQRTPLIFGSGREVAKLTRYHTDPSSIAERAPLFGNRGLFRL